jgi:hypothetical protein
VEIRLGEKRILEFYIKMAKKMIEFFGRRKVQTDVREYEPYLREVLHPSTGAPIH